MKKKATALLMSLVLGTAVLAGCSDGGSQATTAGDSQAGQTQAGETQGGETQGGETQAGDPTGETAEPSGEQVFRFSSGSVVMGLNPMLNTTGPDNGLHHIVMETLVSNVTDENGNAYIKPAAARDWTISDDGLVYTFNIREDAKWNDGNPVTAQDFEYTFRMMATPATASTNAWLFDGVILNFAQALYNDGTDPDFDKQPEDIGVKALDEKTLEITLEKPTAYFLDLLDGAKPVRQDKYEEFGEEYGSSADKVVTNGPFQVESWDMNVQMTMVRNEHYWDAENVILDKIERKIISENATAAQALISGEIDVHSTTDPDWQGMIAGSGDYEARVIESGAPEFYGFNASSKYFKNPKIRTAFMLGYDRQGYVDAITDGTGAPIYSMMPDNINVGNTPYHDVVEDRNYIVKNLQEEYPDPKVLLIEGLTEEGLDPDPANMTVTLATRGVAEFSKKSAEWMKQEWESKLGVTVDIDMMEWNIMWDKVDAGEYEIATAGWGPYYNDPNGLLSIYHPEDGYFDSAKSGWTGEDAQKFGELLDQAALETDELVRAELFLEAEELLVGTGVISPTYLYTDTTFIANYVKGYQENAHAYPDYTKIYIAR